jgi:sulfite oxidase
MRAEDRERLLELYANDPERADALVFGRRMRIGRRGFLNGAGLAAMSAAVGAAIPFAEHMPAGLVPAALAQVPPPQRNVLRMDGKAELTVLQDQPLNAEPLNYFLDEPATSTEFHYIANSGLPPEPPADPQAWKVRIDGEVNTPLDLTVGELTSRFPQSTGEFQIESGGNGRAFVSPATPGIQWGGCAVGCAEWSGVSLGVLLRVAGLKPSAVYTAHFGADRPISADRPVISRGIPLAKAMDQNTLVATAMNGEPIPLIHGGPVRLIVPGWPGSASHKWLTRIWIRDRVHDGHGMQSPFYHVTRTPMIPGGTTPDSNLKILESMPVRSIISNVPNGIELPSGIRAIGVRGHAWAGEGRVRTVAISINYGVTWTGVQQLLPQPNRHAWQNWQTGLTLPSEGYFEIWVRATEQEGAMQPHIAGDWNPGGYGANPIQRVSLIATA